MLDYACIFSTGGIVLYEKQFTPLRSDPLADLISSVLVAQSSTLSSHSEGFLSGPYRLKWNLHAPLQIVFVVIYQASLQLTYVETLLDEMRRAFVEAFQESLQVPDAVFTQDFDFDATFMRVLCEVEDADLEAKRNRSQRSFEETKKFQQTGKAKTKKSGKEDRKWDGSVSTKDAKALDFSNEELTEDAVKKASQNLVNDNDLKKMKRSRNGLEVLEMEGGDDQVDETTGLFASIKSTLSQLTGTKVITKKDLDPVLSKMKEHLISKNVASDVATKICDMLADNLAGSKQGSFKTLMTTVKESLEVALKKILTPKTSSDLLQEIQIVNRNKKRPYVFAFIGVNGVGKSTNLAKTCFWLLQNNLKVLLVAGDTFRSGAVEQLGVHVRNLKAIDDQSQVELFERGYGKDAATIAKDAIQYATREKFDVVLIDTAGRMQDNEPLMRALAKLVSVNNPDKIIFVGEALVGNEAVDQMTKFNKALRDFSDLPKPRQIDGFILTKFDTVDDKVGTALSMTYITGQPILFVGTGQTYTDLKRMNIRHICQTLLSS